MTERGLQVFSISSFIMASFFHLQVIVIGLWFENIYFDASHQQLVTL